MKEETQKEAPAPTAWTEPSGEPETEETTEPSAIRRDAPQNASEAPGEFEIVFSNPPDDFVLDGRYGSPMGFAGTAFVYEDESQEQPDVVELDMAPAFDVYAHKDAEGNMQLRAYGQKFRVMSKRVNADGAMEKILAEQPEPDGSGMYAVMLDLWPDVANVYTELDAPIALEQENFAPES